MAKKDALAPKASVVSIVQQMPEYLRQAPTAPIRGAENVEAADRVMPRLALASKQSPQCDEENEKYIDGLRQGDFFNTISREIYGSTIYIVPLFELKTRAKNRPYGESGPAYCQSFNGKTGVGDPGGDCRTCPHSKWTMVPGKQKNQKPACTENLNFAVLVMPSSGKLDEATYTWDVAPREDTISILGFKSTSFGKGQELITMLDMRGRDWFTTVFKLSSFPKSDGKNSWHIPIPENAGWLAQAATEVSRPCYESIHQVYASGRMKVDDQEQEETVSV